MIPQTPSSYDTTRVIERPDGLYWQSKETGEAENEVGISGWIDADTGLPAADSVPRTEEH